MQGQNRGGPSGPPALFRKWLELLAGVAAIVLFLFIVAPAARDRIGIAGAVDEIRQRDIEIGAYYYTGVEQVRDAELFIRHSREYPVASDRSSSPSAFGNAAHRPK